MRAHLRAGIAVYNAGHYHAAHDAWEERWLAVKETDRDRDERLLHGLIQFTAAVHHGREGNWPGVRGLAESAGEYLAGLPADYRGVNVGTVREYLAPLADDPERVGRVAPPALTHEGRALALDDLEFEAVAVAAGVFAEAVPAYEEAVVEDAVAFARESVQAGGADEFVALVFDFVTDADRRDVVYRRLAAHVERRRRERDDVAGLFGERDRT